MKQEGINVLSLFDGMSCGQIALERAGIKVNNYFASEIKKHAIETTMLNYPNTIQLGDVTKVKASDLPKIDLLIGGSPCQDFSSQNRERKGLAGIKSNLFFEYLRLWHEIRHLNPEAKFLLENVNMLPIHYSQLSKYMECYPVRINGNRVSAAYRDRLFWSNIRQYKDMFGFNYTDIPQPKLRHIHLQDILTHGYANKRFANCLKTKNGGTLGDVNKNIVLVHKRQTLSGFDNFIFNSPDFDISKGVRFLNQIELERLHNIPEGYTKNLTVKKAHDLIGDGWTVDLIVHIFSFLKYKACYSE